MKKHITLALLLIVSATTFSAKADDRKKISYRVLESFANRFTEVTAVNWYLTPTNLSRAIFSAEGRQASAFFAETGEYVATTYDLNFAQLPAKLQKTFTDKLKGATPKEVVELENDADHLYFVSCIQDGKEVIYKGFANGYAEKANGYKFVIK
jgi:hypothetical protein